MSSERPVAEFPGLIAKTRLIALGLAISVPAGVSPQVAPGLPATSAPPTEVALDGLDGLIEDALRRWGAPGAAVAVVRDGEVVLAKGYGTRDPASGAPMTEHTVIPMASLVKMVTSFGLGLLVGEGSMSFDAPISEYIPGFRMHDPIATVEVSARDLLSHRSGLPSHWFLWYGNQDLSREELIARLPHLPLTAPIRTTWNYSGLGYAIVAHAMERQSGSRGSGLPKSGSSPRWA